MGTCCSKIDNADKHGVSGIEGSPSDPSLKLQKASHQHWLSDMQGANIHDTCQLLTGSAAPSTRLHYNVKDLIYGSTNQLTENVQAHEECINSQFIGLPSDKDSASMHKLAHDDLHEGCLVLGNHEDADAHLLSSLSVITILNLSRRMAACNVHNIDPSHGIKLQVRYKHMFPQTAQTDDGHFEGNALKRARSCDKLVLADPEGHPSSRRCKISRVNSDDHHSISNHGSIMSLQMRSDVNDGADDDDDDGDFGGEDYFHNSDSDYGDQDDEYHDITLGVSKTSVNTDHGFVTRGLKGEHEDRGFDYGMSQQSTMFICQEEVASRVAWHERVEAVEAMEDMEKTMLPLSVVSTGDAILFSGSNSDELHLIPSKFLLQESMFPLLTSPNQNFNHPGSIIPRSLGSKREKFSLSVEDIILLLDNDELNEDDLLAMLMDSSVKSSRTSSPSMSCASSPSSASSIIWSVLPPPLSLSSSSSTSSASSGASALPLSSSSSTSSASSGASALPVSSCTEALQLSSSSTPCALSLPYSLSLMPSSCKMYSPHTSFEFNVKSGNSTPSTPVFSPIRSRAKRSTAKLKPSALTTEEIVEIWGMFEQRRASRIP